ncbi:MAG: Shedu anti-phage system protein SduA domain-containing protein [Candidatus Thermoplasmatota archaeon]
MGIFLGRVFRDSGTYDCQSRIVTGHTSNKSWAYTVDTAIEVETGRRVVQVVRWRARIDRTGPKTKIWQRWRTYNIRSIEQWISARNVVDDLFDTVSVSDGTYSSIECPVSVDDQEEAFEAMSAELAEANAAKAHYRKQSREARGKLSEHKKHIMHYRRTLNAFSRLVSEDDVTETEVHRFIEIEKPAWMFGLDYASIEGHVAFPPKGKKQHIFDLMLRRHDSFLDLVELKGPNESIFDRKTRTRSKLNVALSTAIGQVLTYMDVCDKRPSYKVFRPRALIVIGKKATDNPLQRRLLTGHLSRIDIITYDDMIARGNALVKYIQTGHIHSTRS